MRDPQQVTAVTPALKIRRVMSCGVRAPGTATRHIHVTPNAAPETLSARKLSVIAANFLADYTLTATA